MYILNAIIILNMLFLISFLFNFILHTHYQFSSVIFSVNVFVPADSVEL